MNTTRYCIRVAGTKPMWVSGENGDPERTLLKRYALTFCDQYEALKFIFMNRLTIKYPTRDLYFEEY